jgi:peptidoglycan/LPS O-acetylase OafA/YrhL
VGWLLQGAWILALSKLVAPNRSGFLIYQLPLTHLFEFVLGVCGGILTTRLPARQLNILISLAAVTALLGAAALHVWNIAMPDSYGMIPLFFALIIGTTRASGSLWLAPLRNSGVVALGHASYALYIIHLPLLVGAAVLGVANGIGWFWLPVLMAISLCVHYGYAEPVRRLLLRPSSNAGVAIRQ